MARTRLRTAVSPLRRHFELIEAPRPRVDAVIVAERPSEPLYCLRPAVITAAAQRFVAAFPGDVLYAVKCNPEPAVLRAAWAGGIRHYDCASPVEIALVRSALPEAAIHYMHPVKSRAAIREAYARHGVRDFALDSFDELAKLRTETANARDLGLIVRLALPKGNAAYDLSGKFGAELDEAAALLRAARLLTGRLGVAFHVGSECLEPLAYRHALERAGEAIRRAGVPVEIVDVGGSFPVSYPDMIPPALDVYMAEIEAGFSALNLPAATRLWAEPGRAIVGAGASVVVRVELRRGAALYINDGVYGILSDAGTPRFRFPARLIRPDAAESAAAPMPFELWGPTCDSADHMRGPFYLPADIAEGDFVEIGQVGAYGACLRTAFNGFDRARLVEVSDGPLLATPGVEPEPDGTAILPTPSRDRRVSRRNLASIAGKEKGK